jgi:hypothetical protein
MVLGKGTDSRRAPALHNASLVLGHRGSSFSRTEGRRLSHSDEGDCGLSSREDWERQRLRPDKSSVTDDGVAFARTGSRVSELLEPPRHLIASQMHDRTKLTS